jgi:DNA (cytosine-5)-methyltransferase 1
LETPKFRRLDSGKRMKPKYSIPSMEEVKKKKGTNGFTMVSTFSGCGGSCLGFEMAGYDLRWANEFIPEARETYRANHDGVILDGRDIREVKGSEILEAIRLKKGELDLFEGSPPCASFSTVGSREKGWGKVKAYSDSEQRADDLFFEYSRLIEETQPKTFIAENVSGLVRGTALGYFREILRDLRSKGYLVEAKLLDASWLGVPQARKRIIFVGVRNDLVDKYKVAPAFPSPFDYQYSLNEALEDTTPLEKYLDQETGMDISLDRYAIGSEWDRTPIGKISDKYLSLVKPHPLKPINTITATVGNVGAASVVHPTEKRKFTLEELRLLSSFPKDFELTGTYAQRCERIGRSVPPLMAKAIGEAIAEKILSKTL